MSRLFDFLTEMALNPARSEQFAEQAQDMMETAGLSDMEQKAVQSGDRTQLTTALAGELETHELVAVMGSCAGSDPGPDPSPDPDPFPNL